MTVEEDLADAVSMASSPYITALHTARRCQLLTSLEMYLICSQAQEAEQKSKEAAKQAQGTAKEYAQAAAERAQQAAERAKQEVAERTRYAQRLHDRTHEPDSP